jgi:hypothetical protein
LYRFAQDPNHTSAWNGLISGVKKWLLYPPNCTPPGVIPSADGAQVATPLSVAEWFLNYYEQHTHLLQRYKTQRPRDNPEKLSGNESETGDEVFNTPITSNYAEQGPIEATCLAGELIFIPCSWWHCALNLEPSIAATQNYVNQQNLISVLDFLFCEQNYDLLKAFKQQLNAKKPGLIEKLQAKYNKLVEAQEAQATQATEKKKAASWFNYAGEDVCTGATTTNGRVGFQFSFSAQDESEHP